MPGVGSSPTTRNGFEEQASGANTNTWGTLLNNTEQLIDDALDGVQTLALTTGGVTLTTTSYVTNQARMRVLLLTGTLTGAVPLTIPANQKWYIVQNNTTGAFAVTIGATGNTQATCPQGRRTIVYCDGTNTFSNEIPLNLIDAPTGDVSVAGHKLTNLAPAMASTDAVSLANTIDQLAAAAADVNFNTHKLLNVATPVSPTDGVNKSYADDLITTNVITGFIATSTSAVAIGTGAKTLTVQTAKLFQAGQFITASDHANPTINYMIGQVTAYNATTGALAFTVSAAGAAGSGTPAQYDIALSGSQGATGAPGPSANVLPVVERASNTMIVATDLGKAFKITAGSFTQTFDTPVNLGSSFSIEYENAGTGKITHTSDGVAGWLMYPGERRRFYSDGASVKTELLQGHAWYEIAATENYIWPPLQTAADVDLLGSGGGGGGGSKQADGTERGGGGGGGGGAREKNTIAKADTGITDGASIAVTIAAGGTKGNGATINGNGGDAGDGGTTSFGTYLSAPGGKKGLGGIVGNVASGGAGAAISGTSAVADALAKQGAAAGGAADGQNADWGGASGAGTRGSTATPTKGGSSLKGGPGGASGGGITTGNTETDGGAGGIEGAYTAGGGAPGGTHGATPNGTNGSVNTSGKALSPGGGGAQKAANGGTAGTAPRAAGGSGGGASRDGNSGDGSVGGAGYAWVKGVR